MEKVKVDEEGKPTKENEVRIEDCGIYKEEKKEEKKEKIVEKEEKKEKEEKHHHHSHHHKEEKEKEEKEPEKVVVVSSIIIGNDNSKYIPQQQQHLSPSPVVVSPNIINNKPIIRKVNGHEVKGRGLYKYLLLLL